MRFDLLVAVNTLTRGQPVRFFWLMTGSARCSFVSIYQLKIRKVVIKSFLIKRRNVGSPANVVSMTVTAVLRFGRHPFAVIARRISHISSDGFVTVKAQVSL